MSNDKFEQAINLYKAGNKERARELLLEVVNMEPNNAEAWLGLAICTEDLEKKKEFLEKVIEINPSHSKAKQLLQGIHNTSDSTENFAVRPIPAQKKNVSMYKVVTSVLIGLLILCVGWLFYKVYNLEKTLIKTQAELLQVQSELSNTQIVLDSVSRTLSYVKAVAENADRYAHSHSIFSDSRLKMNIAPIADPLQGVMSLNGITFYWNTSDHPDLGFNNERQFGFIAQEVEQIYPELVHTENGYKTVNYVELIPILTEAIKQQQMMILDLQTEISRMRQNQSQTSVRGQ